MTEMTQMEYDLAVRGVDYLERIAAALEAGTVEGSWQFVGIVMADGKRPRPGGSAVSRYYAELYVHTGTGKRQLAALSGDFTSYTPKMEGSRPCSDEDYKVLVPASDR